MTTASSGATWGTVIADYWWVPVLFGGSFLAWLGETTGAIGTALRRRKAARRKHELKLARLQLQIAEAAQEKSRPRLTAGPCKHLDVTAVRSSVTDEIVAWLCKNPACSARLPADWSVYEEDL